MSVDISDSFKNNKYYKILIFSNTDWNGYNLNIYCISLNKNNNFKYHLNKLDLKPQNPIMFSFLYTNTNLGILLFLA